MSEHCDEVWRDTTGCWGAGEDWAVAQTVTKSRMRWTKRGGGMMRLWASVNAGEARRRWVRGRVGRGIPSLNEGAGWEGGHAEAKSVLQLLCFGEVRNVCILGRVFCRGGG